MCSALVQRHPGYVAALHTLGLVYLDKGNFERALDCLVRASMLNPQGWMTLTALGHTYLRLGAVEMAASTLEQARRINPQEASILVSLGEAYEENRDYERAQEAYDAALKLEPELEAAAIGLAMSCSAMGEHAAAAAAIRHALKQGHGSLQLFRAISTLPPNSAGIDFLAELDCRLVRRSDAEFNNTFAFVRAAALDMAGRHAEAWECLVPANRALFEKKQKEVNAETKRQDESLAALREFSVKPAKASLGQPLPVSLFILGPSRSGKTTLEQLVGLLDGVKRGYEGLIVDNAIRRSFQTEGLPTSLLFERLPSSAHALFRQFYLEELNRSAGSARVLTNTVSARIHDAAHIATAIPNARFAFVKRNLQDNALRIYLRKYIRGNAYAYQIRTIHEHLLWYYRMIDLMAEKFPERVLVITYETMVADPAAALQRVAELCGLAGQPSSLPAIGDDRGCAAPYREFMSAALQE